MTKWTTIILRTSILLFGHLCSAQTDSLYENELKKADSAYSFKSWGGKDNPADTTKFETAKKFYVNALSIKPNETYPKSRIKEIDKILYDFKTRPIYNTLILKADSLFSTDNFTTAKIYYLKADSLYPGEHTKKKLSAIQALTNLAENSNDSILFIKHGTSFGMCDGYCFHETKFTKDLIINTGKSWTNNQPDKVDTARMERNNWKNMVNAIDIKAFYMLPATMGCPDCTDGGAEWLIIGTKNSEWKVEFDYGSDTVTTKKLLSIIRPTK
jgi:tetratricopeptide (TPR) repeat protein